MKKLRQNLEIGYKFVKMKKINVLAYNLLLMFKVKEAARFIIERINQNTETVADSLITIFVPYEANVPILPNGITLAVDTAEPFTEQFLFCDQLGCTSQFGLTKQGIELFMTGANLAIYMIDIRNPNNKFIVDVDLENFDKIYDSITP